MSIKFDGQNDYLDLGTIPLEVTRNTIEMWIKPYAIPDDMRLIGGHNHSTDLHVGFTGNKIKVWPSGGWKVITNSTVPTNQWTHVALVKEGNRLTCYINGNNELTVDNTASTYRTFIGRQYAKVYGKYFSGEIEEVRYWNVARSEAEIKADMNMAVDPGESSLAAYYPLRDGSGLTANDETGKNPAGKLVDFDANKAWVSPGAPIISGTVYDQPGAHQHTVSADGAVTITTCGADGGNSFGNNLNGGAGAEMTASFDLKAGDKLTVIVGRAGVVGQVDARAGGGGGGGSAVILNGSTVLIEAGAGGGAARMAAGQGGRAGVAVLPGGGDAGGSLGGAGGGGFGHAGKPVNVDPVAQGGGAGTVNGPGAGGIGHNPQHSQGGDGGAGFGGGGGSHKQGGGGGGGFQGGAGSASNNGAAQGGLSFVNVGVNGATVVNQASGGDGQGQGADGRVIIN